MPSRDFGTASGSFKRSCAVPERGEPKSVFIHVVHEKYRYLDVFVVIDVVIVQVP